MDASHDTLRATFWKPALSTGKGPRYLRLASFIEQSVADGRLWPGDRLPAQRELASWLGIDFTTVTRAYNRARDRHAIEGRGPLGTFVSTPRIAIDQVLDLGGRRLVKSGDRAGARRQIGELQGRTHRLVSAVVVAEGTGCVWQHVADARLTMRPLSAVSIERYLDEAGEGIFGSVGAYHLEGVGVRLFEAIEGDYFTILGLPLLPLIGWLRARGLIDQENTP